MPPEPAGAASVVDVRNRAGAPVLCRVTGEIDISTVDQLRAGLADAIAREPAVVVDLSAVTFLASAGVRALIEAGTGTDRYLAVVLGPAVRTVVRICGMAELVDCFSDLGGAEQACRSVAGAAGPSS